MSGCDYYIHTLVPDDFYYVSGGSAEPDAPVEKDITAGTVSGFLDALQRDIKGERSTQLNSQTVLEYLEVARNNNGKEQRYENSDGEHRNRQFGIKIEEDQSQQQEEHNEPADHGFQP